MNCQKIGTKTCFASIYHPQTNGACERANALIFSVLSKRICDDAKGMWADELPCVLWAHRTSASRSTGFTPFCLLFGDKAMSPEEAKNMSLSSSGETRSIVQGPAGRITGSSSTKPEMIPPQDNKLAKQEDERAFLRECRSHPQA